MKQLIILVCYLNVGNSSQNRAQENMANLKKIVEKEFSQELQDETNTIIKTLVIAIRDQNTYIECIYPSEPYLPEEIIEKIEQIELTQKEYDTNRPKN